MEIRRELKLAEGKIFFMMCWVHAQPGKAWSSAAAILKVERPSCIDYGGGENTVKMVDKSRIKKQTFD